MNQGWDVFNGYNFGYTQMMTKQITIRKYHTFAFDFEIFLGKIFVIFRFSGLHYMTSY